MKKDKGKLMINSNIMCKFDYCLLVWMCHSRTLNKEIIKVHERVLRILYNDHRSIFRSDQLKNTPHYLQKNLQYLTVDSLKVKIGDTPVIIKDIFQYAEDAVQKLRTNNHLQSTK